MSMLDDRRERVFRRMQTIRRICPFNEALEAEYQKIMMGAMNAKMRAKNGSTRKPTTQAYAAFRMVIRRVEPMVHDALEERISNLKRLTERSDLFA